MYLQYEEPYVSDRRGVKPWSLWVADKSPILGTPSAG